MEILEQYCLIDNRISIINLKENKGPGSARNIGIENVHSEYIFFVDAGDIMLPKRLQLQYEFMENNPNVDISGSWMQSFGQRE